MLFCAYGYFKSHSWCTLLWHGAFAWCLGSSMIRAFFVLCLVILQCSLNSILGQHYHKQHTYNHFTAVWILSETTRVSRYQKKQSPTHTYRGHQSSLSASSIYYDPWHLHCSSYVPDSFFPQSLQVYLLAWHPPLHTPYISSPNHCLLFAAYAHTIATCFAVVPRLCHLMLVSLLTITWNSILQLHTTHL